MFAWRRQEGERRIAAGLEQLRAEAAEAGAWAGQGASNDGFVESLGPALRALAVPTLLSADVDSELLAAQAAALQTERDRIAGRVLVRDVPLAWWRFMRRFGQWRASVRAARDTRKQVRRLTKEMRALQRESRRAIRARSRMDGWVAVHEAVIRGEYERHRARAILAGQRSAGDRQTGTPAQTHGLLDVENVTVTASEARSVQ
jgi:hypothetical protein